MRKLYALTFLTLDGVMQSDDGPEVDPSGGFTYGGWSTPYFDDFLEQTLAEHQSAPFDFVLGRKTYEQFAAFWPYQSSETFPLAQRLHLLLLCLFAQHCAALLESPCERPPKNR